MSFQKNVHPMERGVRVLIGWCPPYQLFGITTCKTKNSNLN